MTCIDDYAAAIPLDRDDLVVFDPELGDAREMTDDEWAAVSANLEGAAEEAAERSVNGEYVVENDKLVDAAGEPRDPDAYVAALQDDRDRCAARGDFERADALNAQVQDLRHPVLDVPAPRASEPLSLDAVDQVAAQERADRADPSLARLLNARDHEAAGGRFDVADAAQRLIEHSRATEDSRADREVRAGRDQGLVLVCGANRRVARDRDRGRCRE